MIDVHFHCLPGIDDGPQDWDESVALCRAAAEDGVETIVATPHVLRDPWINDDPKVLDRLVLELNTRLGGRPRILPGCEAFFCSDLVALWEKGSEGPLIALNRRLHLLVEFAATAVPRHAESAVHELLLLGVTTVIAHPERNLVFAREPERLRRLVQLGAMTQVTAASVLGELGPQVETLTADWIEEGLVHFVASDGHSISKRPPRLAPARRRVLERWGENVEKQLFELNPTHAVGEQVERSQTRTASAGAISQ